MLRDVTNSECESVMLKAGRWELGCAEQHCKKWQQLKDLFDSGAVSIRESSQKIWSCICFKAVFNTDRTVQ